MSSPADGLGVERLNVGAGWQALIDEVHAGLVGLCPGYQVLQIKEKFGGLRYHVSLPEDADLDTLERARDLIFEAEEKSLKTCEDCGSTLETVTTQASPGRYWVRTLCGECR